VPDNTNKNHAIYQRLDEQFIALVDRSVEKVDYLVVMLHWGLEESTVPLPYQRDLAERLKKAGVKLVIGNHPHLFYEIEASNDFVCAYSLGNFVFDLCWDKRLLKTGILEVTIDEFGHMKTFVLPVDITKDGCLPLPTGERKEVIKSHTLYDLGDKIANQQIKKVAYHLLNIFRGKTWLKLIFFKRKILK
jgi:poly-gamma-glutamate synthesis protein (capsule biosynthesis protein)